jgi:pentatricopeptide repeat protein
LPCWRYKKDPKKCNESKVLDLGQALNPQPWSQPNPKLQSGKEKVLSFGKCGREGRMEDAVNIFEELQRAGLKPDVVSYTALLQGYGKLKQFNKVTDVFNQMQHNRCRPDLRFCTELISTYGDGGLTGNAESVMEYIRVVGLQPDAVVYTALVHAYAEQGLWAEAEKTLRYFTSL